MGEEAEKERKEKAEQNIFYNRNTRGKSKIKCQVLKKRFSLFHTHTIHVCWVGRGTCYMLKHVLMSTTVLNNLK